MEIIINNIIGFENSNEIDEAIDEDHINLIIIIIYYNLLKLYIIRR